MGCVCVIADHQKGRIKKATLSAIAFGKMAAESLNADLNILVVGNNVSDIADSLSQFGASGVWVVDDPALEHYSAQTWGHAVFEGAKKCGATLLCMNSGTTARDLMPRVAAKLDAGMATDVIGFDGTLFTREMYAGNAVAEVEVLTDIKVATVQGTVFDPAQPSDKTASVERLDISMPQPKARFVDFLETVSERPELTESPVVVSGGRGMKDPENFKMIEELADFFNGAVGATRAAVDAGWLSNDFQVGQTGKKVAPELYVAIGLSGAIQHIAGMKNSKVIVAINKDEEAPIFEVADYGLVADLFKAVPELLSGLKPFECKA